jgi:hypothetical protein
LLLHLRKNSPKTVQVEMPNFWHGSHDVLMRGHCASQGETEPSEMEGFPKGHER